MANWDDIKAGVGRVANKTAKKVGEIADIASMQFKVRTLTAKKNTKFEKLGKLTYKQFKSDITQAEAIAVTVNEIDEIIAQIKELKEKIEAAKKESKSADDVDLSGEEEQEGSEE